MVRELLLNVTETKWFLQFKRKEGLQFSAIGKMKA
jgi:hypothetical protein